MADAGKRLAAYALALGFVVVAAGVAAGATQAEKDARLGNHVDIILRETFVTLEDDELTNRVSQIGNKVLEAAGNPNGYTFRFRILNDPTPNAMAAAAGYIYVTTGLLQTLRSEDELAAVIAHEIGHVNRRHPARLAPNSTKITLTTIGLQVGTLVAAQFAAAAVSQVLANAVSSYDVYRAASMAANLTSLALSDLGQRVLKNMYDGYAKDKEFEADGLAVEYAQAAGYKPGALADVLERLLETRRAEGARHFVTYVHSRPSRLTQRLQKIRNAP